MLCSLARSLRPSVRSILLPVSVCVFLAVSLLHARCGFRHTHTHDLALLLPLCTLHCTAFIACALEVFIKYWNWILQRVKHSENEPSVMYGFGAYTVLAYRFFSLLLPIIKITGKFKSRIGPNDHRPKSFNGPINVLPKHNDYMTQNNIRWCDDYGVIGRRLFWNTAHTENIVGHRRKSKQTCVYSTQSNSSKNWSIFMKNMFYNRLPISGTHQLKFLEGTFRLFIHNFLSFFLFVSLSLSPFLSLSLCVYYVSTSYSVLGQLDSWHIIFLQWPTSDCLPIVHRPAAIYENVWPSSKEKSTSEILFDAYKHTE